MIKSWLRFVLTLIILGVLAVVTEEFILLGLLTFFFILPFFAIGVHQLFPKPLRVAMHLDEKGEKFKTVKGEVVLRNEGYLPFGMVFLRLNSENLLTQEKASLKILSPLTLKGDQVIPIKFKSHHGGQILFRIEEIKVYDVFGLSFRRVKETTQAKTLILPQFYQSNPLLLSKAQGKEDEFMTEYDEQLKGGDYSEVFQYKTYEKGDSLSRINWKLSGKLGELMVKVGSKPVPRSILMILDTSVLREDELTWAKKRDGMMETFLAVSQGLLLNNLSHGVGFYDHKDQGFVHSLLEYEDQLFAFLPQLLRAGEQFDEKSALDHYEDFRENLTYDHIIFVTSTLPKHKGTFGEKISVLLVHDESLKPTVQKDRFIHPIHIHDLEYSLASLEL